MVKEKSYLKFIYKEKEGYFMRYTKERPFVGFHTRISSHDAVEPFISLIEKGLQPIGINALILEFNPGYQYKCFPELSNGTFGREDSLRLREVCDKYGIEIIPLFQCLSHQSDHLIDKVIPWPLLRLHPEFDETPYIGSDTEWPAFYTHSWCASNMDIYKYIFPMMDEIIEDLNAKTVHIGLDEVFEIADENCPRCKGKNPAELFANTVKVLYDHLTEKGIDVMMWGDRLLDADKLGYQMWEADKFGIHEAFDMEDKISRNITITDWHYDMHDHGYPSVEKFLKAGFDVIPSFGCDNEQAAHFWKFALEAIYLGNKYHWKGNVVGLLFTQWMTLTKEIAEDILAGINNEKPAPKGWTGTDVGHTIRRITPKGKFLKKETF